jgi:hypothetical protein
MTGRWLPHFSLGLVLVLPAANGVAADAEAARTIVLVRRGKLDPAEVSPGPGATPQALWKVALEGVTLTRLEAREGDAVPLAPEAIRGAVLTDALAAAARERKIEPVFVDLNERAPESEPSPALKALHGIFGAPAPVAPPEAAAVAALRKAVGAPSLPSAPPPAASKPSAERFSGAMGSPLAVILETAAGSSQDEVVERDRRVALAAEAVGPDGHVLIVSLPESGPGSLIARGPGLRRSRLSERKRTLGVVAACAAHILDPAAPRDESIAELFAPQK